jgi:hypothetical protein
MRPGSAAGLIDLAGGVVIDARQRHGVDADGDGTFALVPKWLRRATRESPLPVARAFPRMYRGRYL